METIHGNNVSTSRINDSKKDSLVATMFNKSNHINPLQIVERRDIYPELKDVDKPRVKMDPYKELELYFAKVNVSNFFFFAFKLLFLFFFFHVYYAFIYLLNATI